MKRAAHRVALFICPGSGNADQGRHREKSCRLKSALQTLAAPALVVPTLVGTVKKAAD
jgi:hypothetical protein